MFPVGSGLDSALDCLFPRVCVGCGRPGGFLCASCRQTVVRIEPPTCPLCGRPQSSDVLCPSCASRRPAIDGIRSVFRLEGAIRHAVHELKYNNLRAIAPMLAHHLHMCLKESGLEPDTIVPVPLHRTRERRRGYNQSFLLARALSHDTGLPVKSQLLTRTRNTESQVGSRSARTRSLNVAGAFHCPDDAATGTSILLIDDVCTTGATLEDCARALRTAGASRVWGLTVAREI